MAVIGLNVPRDGEMKANEIRNLRASWIRIVAMAQHNLRGYLNECREKGIRTLMVIAKESFDGIPVGDLIGSFYHERYGDLVTAWQIGNEPDLTSESSWTMSQEAYSVFGKAMREQMPKAHLVTAGFASGHPEWTDKADLSWADSIAVHPYLKDAPNPNDLEDLDDVTTLLDAYRLRFPKQPVVVTEWGWWGSEEGRATEETRDMIRWAAETNGIGAFFYFCASDAMVSPFGLLDAEWRPKDRATAFTVAARDVIDNGWPQPHVEQPAEPQPEPPAANKPDPWKWWSPEHIAATIRCPEAAVREHWPRLTEQLGHCGLYEMRVAAAMLATVAIETAHYFEPIHEFQDWQRYPNSGGYPPHYEGGPNYHGRGFIQVTHLGNYRKYGQQIAVLWGAGGWEPDFDWVRFPDNALDPDMSAAASALYFRNHGGDGLELVANAARQENWREVRRLVQGGSAGLDTFTSYASRLVATANPDEQPQEPPADPRDAEIEGLKTALRHVIDVTLPNAAATAAEYDDAANRRAEAMAEAARIRKQFLG